MGTEKYQLKLSNFDGPLDLLLHLISRAKIEIKDIFVSEITEQYLSYVRQSDLTDLDSASEFLEMAATLLYIKSRALLPKAKVEEEDGLSEEDKLIQRLDEYKKYKEAAEQMRQMEEQGRTFFYKLPEELIDTRAPVILNASVQALTEAYRLLMEKIDKQEQDRPEVVVNPDYVSMHAKMNLILMRVNSGKELNFFDLFSPSPTRMEVAVTFYALLELIGQGKITVKQKDMFGNIGIYRKQKESENTNG